MAIQKENGSVSIEAQNIMPVIKRWLYSDKDIFLREAVSNACDAITKYRMLHPDAQEEMQVKVTVDSKNKTIRISDTGIGMTAEEVKKYINQVAFSGASEFLKQFEGQEGKDQEKNDIIGYLLSHPCKTNDHDHFISREFAFIDEIYVAPEYRKKSLAKQLILYAKNHFKGLGYSSIELFVSYKNTIARNVYEESGFFIQSIRMECII